MSIDLTKQVFISKVAALVASGAEAPAIAKELGVTPQKVRYYMHTSECKDMINKLLTEVTTDIVKQAKKDLAKLMPKALKALEANLDDNDLKAVEIVLKSTGALTEEAGNQQATAITVVLPSGESSEAIKLSDEDYKTTEQ